jgi:hypothetical protein
MTKKAAMATVEIVLPEATRLAIMAYAEANSPMTFDEATNRFITLGKVIEDLANQDGVLIVCNLPTVRLPSPRVVRPQKEPKK